MKRSLLVLIAVLGLSGCAGLAAVGELRLTYNGGIASCRSGV